MTKKINLSKIFLIFILLLILGIISKFVIFSLNYPVQIPDSYHQIQMKIKPNTSEIKLADQLILELSKGMKKNELIAIIKRPEIEIDEYYEGNDLLSNVETVGIGSLEFHFDRNGNLKTVQRSYGKQVEFENYNIFYESINISYLFGWMLDGKGIMDGDVVMLSGFVLILLVIIGVVYYFIYEFKSKENKHIIVSRNILIIVNFVGFIFLFYRFYVFQKVFKDASTYYNIESLIRFLLGSHYWFIYPSFLFDIMIINFVFLLWIVWRENRILHRIPSNS